MAIAGLVLTACALTLLILHWDILLIARWSGVLTLAALVAISLAIGHLLGGPAEDDRTALAIACGTRHIGIAVLVAASVPGPRTSVLVAFYILTSAVISIPYLRWRRRASASRVRPHGPEELRGSLSN
jgi:BASS family bile acid:Na+ symporter